VKEINEKKLTKLYYSIGEVAEIFNVNTSLIRFWEKEFNIIQPKKNKKGNRLFTPKDILNFNKIYHLVKIKGFTLDGAKKALKSNETELFEDTTNETSDTVSDNNIEEVISNLENIKKKLILLKSSNY
jgi:DNA-binding transcriptional MerR regulator